MGGLGFRASALKSFPKLLLSARLTCSIVGKRMRVTHFVQKIAPAGALGFYNILTHSRRQCFYMENPICFIFPGDDGIFIPLTKKLTLKITMRVERARERNPSSYPLSLHVLRLRAHFFSNISIL